nr:hypothetical protein [Rhodococcus sp. 15-1154-1]
MSATTDAEPQHDTPAHRHRPPADHRFLGLDTRVVPHALAILAVWLLWVVIVPAVDSAVTRENPVADGDRLSVTDTLTLTPAQEWNIDSGFRVDERGASNSLPAIALSRGNIQLSVQADSFDGTADELLTQIDAVGTGTGGSSILALSGDRTPFVADGGLTGVQVSFNTPSNAGTVTAIVVDGTGIEAQVVGPPDQIIDRTTEITDMLSSIGASEGRGQ